LEEILFTQEWGLVASSFLIGTASGIVPFCSIEAYLVSMALLVPGPELLGLLVATTVGHMLAKYALFLAGEGVVSLPFARAADARLQDLRDGLGKSPRTPALVVLSSAVTGLPPFYVMSLVAGSLRWPRGRFLLVGGAGRFIRFAALVVLTRLASGAGL
jgi:membrane protein YqaA with SNARE-associated domain